MLLWTVLWHLIVNNIRSLLSSKHGLDIMNFIWIKITKTMFKFMKSSGEKLSCVSCKFYVTNVIAVRTLKFWLNFSLFIFWDQFKFWRALAWHMHKVRNPKCNFSEIYILMLNHVMMVFIHFICWHFFLFSEQWLRHVKV